jgi:hypothetical protein
MNVRFLAALAALAFAAGCAFPISDRMARQQGIPTGKPVPEGYVGKALPVEEGEAEGVEGDAPSGVAYPRKYTETGGGIGLLIRSTYFGRREDYLWSNFTVGAHFDLAPKAKTPKRGFYADLGLDIGYPESTIKLTEIDGRSLGSREHDASLIVPYFGFDVSLVGSEIKIDPIGFFEIETRISLAMIGEDYDDVWFSGESEPHDVSAFLMQPGLALIMRRMAGKPTPLEFFEPFAGLAFDLAWMNLSSNPADESFLDYWLTLVLGVRARPIKNVYAELAFEVGTFEQTITFSLGLVF